MEKHGEVKPGVTPDIEDKLTEGVKQASEGTKRDVLDDDFTKRASDAVAEGLKSGLKIGS